MPSISCAHCGHVVVIPNDELGKKRLCRRCKKYFVAPSGLPGEASSPALAPSTGPRPAAKKKTGSPRPLTRPETDLPTKEKDQPEPERAPRRKKPAPVFVDVHYPFRLGVVSFGWTVVGWLLAALAPHLAFLPLIEVFHYVLPTITVGLIGANLFFAVRDLWRGAHPFRLLLVTGLQICLFTTLFFQLFAHVGARWYDVQGPTHAWQWFAFSLAHALRASDVLDVVDAFNMNVQPIRHDGWLVALFVVLYHIVIDVFFLGVLADLGARVRRSLLKDPVIRGWTWLILKVSFALWLLIWVIVALWVKRWSRTDIPLWLVENVLRVVDFADLMESFDLRLHKLPREGLTGTLTFFCRLWIGIGIGLFLGKKKIESERRLATPPDVEAFPYWLRRAGILAGMLLVVLVAGVLWEVLLGDPIPALVQAVRPDTEARAWSALAALQRMGPTGASAIPALAAARPQVSEEVGDEITHTLGFLGRSAADPLTEIALTAPETSALVAVESLGQIRGAAAPGLVKVWSTTTSGAVRDQAEDALRQLGSDAVPPLMEATTTANAAAHYHWFVELDRNWRLHSPSNKVARSLQQLPDLIRALEERPKAARALELINQLKACGTAAREATVALVDWLQYGDLTVQSQVAQLLQTIGPSSTPALLQRLRVQPEYPGALAILKNPQMWDTAALQDPAAVPVLLQLLGQPGADKMAVAMLARIGSRAKPAIPTLVVFLTSQDSSGRQAVRKTLAQVDPNWVKSPQLSRSLPALLPRLSSLPSKEAQELIEGVGDLQEEDGEALVKVLTAGVQKDQEFEYRQAVFTAAEQLGPKLRAAAPALVKAIANPSVSYLMRLRLISSLKKLVPDMEPYVPTVMRAVGQGDVGKVFLRQNAAAALSYLKKLLEGNRREDHWFAASVVAGMGAEARSLLPLLLPRLQDPDLVIRMFGRVTSSRALFLRALDSIDKHWVKDPAAREVLSALVASLVRAQPEQRKQVYDMLGAAGEDARPFVDDVARLLAAGDRVFEDNARKALDQIDSGWRERAVIKEMLPKLIEGLRRSDYGSDHALRHLGGAAVPALKKVVVGGSGEVQTRACQILKAMGKEGRDAIPAMLQGIGNPRLSPEDIKNRIATLRALDPDWLSYPGVKDTIPELITEVASWRAGQRHFLVLCAELGPIALPHVLERLKSKDAVQRRSALFALRDMGRADEDTLAAVTKALQDRHNQVRQAAVAAVGKVGAGHKELVPALVPLLVDDDQYVRLSVVEALKAIDGDWKKSPKLQPALAPIFQKLTDPRPITRIVALGALDKVGPAEGVIPAVERVLKQEKDQQVKRQATWVLNRLHQPNPSPVPSRLAPRPKRPRGPKSPS